MHRLYQIKFEYTTSNLNGGRTLTKCGILGPLNEAERKKCFYRLNIMSTIIHFVERVVMGINS